MFPLRIPLCTSRSVSPPFPRDNRSRMRAGGKGDSWAHSDCARVVGSRQLEPEKRALVKFVKNVK